MELEEIYNFSKKLGKVKFSDLVKHSSGFNIIPIDLTDKLHSEIINKLKLALENFVKTTRKATRFTGARVNDIGSTLENTITEEMRKTDLGVTKLSLSGYPDLIIEYKTTTAYLELKSSGNKNKAGTQHRLFYYTSGKKITKNAPHLLLQIELTEVKDKIWAVDSWVLRDLSGLIVSLKTEFNANQKNFDNLGILAEGHGSEKK